MIRRINSLTDNILLTLMLSLKIIPWLPFQEPPNFLIASDISKHVKPVAVVPSEPEPEPEPELDTPEVESVGNLIDTTEVTALLLHARKVYEK